MKAWLVWKQDPAGYEAPILKGVFSTAEKANGAASTLGEVLPVEDWEMDQIYGE